MQRTSRTWSSSQNGTTARSRKSPTTSSSMRSSAAAGTTCRRPQRRPSRAPSRPGWQSGSSRSIRASRPTGRRPRSTWTHSLSRRSRTTCWSSAASMSIAFPATSGSSGSRNGCDQTSRASAGTSRATTTRSRSGTAAEDSSTPPWEATRTRRTLTAATAGCAASWTRAFCPRPGSCGFERHSWSRMTRRKQQEIEALPLREELDALVHHYYHLRNEHERADPESSTRRRLEDTRRRGRAPREPRAIRPLVYQGRSKVSGSIVEVRRKGDELLVEVDGTLLERVAAEKDLAEPTPALRFRVNGTEFEETFNASPEALRSLADFLGQGGSPPWEHASELLADGLIDVHFDLTPRGRRALARLP